MPDLEQGDVVVAMRRVEGRGLEQSGPERGAQHALLGHQRVGDGQPVRIEAGPGRVTRSEGRVGHGLADAQAVEEPAGPAGAPGLERRQPAATVDFGTVRPSVS